MGSGGQSWRLAGFAALALGITVAAGLVWWRFDDASLPAALAARATCEPASCESLGIECGSRDDGCGGRLECGVCGEGATCSGGHCWSPGPKRFAVSRARCMAPCAVQLDAQSKESLNWPQVRDSEFVWDFGDGGATASGFLAAHVYDRPGTYRVGLTVNDTPWTSETITVDPPKRTICVSPAGAFDDCPSRDAADHFKSLSTALREEQKRTHVLLHRGEEFGSPRGFAKRGPTLYGAFGSGKKPTLTMNEETTIGSDVVWQDLDITTTRVLNLSNGSVLRRIDARGTIGGSPENWLMAYYVNDFFVLDCTATVSDGGNGAAMYVYQAQRSVIKGNQIYRKAGKTGHTIRVNGADGFLFQDNTINEDGGPDSLTIRGDNNTATPNTDANAYWTLVQGNTFENMWPVIKPQFPQANELVRFVIWEKNVQSKSSCLRIETAQDVVVRNNVFSGSFSLGGRKPVCILDHSDFYDPKGIWGIDNRCGEAACEDGRWP